jgi:formylglycine-generating enzyme required for sulfatase activity/energy-coupling factor transporter ATP-binding protein EcfA2
MGSPLVMDDREYLSGTHYEYSEALGGYEQHGKPLVWLYRCQAEPVISMKDPKRDEKNAQFDRVEAFFNQFQDEEGRYTAGVNGYATHADFKGLFKGQLITYLRHLRHHPTETPKPTSTKPKIDVPYRGLRALREEDVPIFFGRTAEASDVLTRIGNKRLVPVLGASGSGKSSLIMAGVLPQLTKQGWRVIQCVPSSQPFDQLALAIVSQIPEMRVTPIDYLNESAKLASTLRQNPQNVVTQLRAVLPTQRIVIYIDQFEELFTVSEKSAIAPFIGAIRHEAQDITTIITMRADFYETALAHLDELKDETYGLKKPSIFALYEMITRPAIEAGYLLDDALAGRIIDEIGEDSGALALVAYVMETMYLRAKARGDKHITHEDYEALGGVQGAINTLAEKAYAELPFDDKETVLRNVFFHLIALTADENGQLVPTRHRYPLGNFPQNSPERDLIDRFADARLLVKDSTMVEVAHEAILRHWEQLKAWIDANKVSMAVYRQFERDASAWAENPDNTPLPSHDQLRYFEKALVTLGMVSDDLKEPLKSYTTPEAMRLLQELENPTTTHARRLWIGDRLGDIGDPRKGVGVLPNGIPDIDWCFVQKGGEITITHEYNSSSFSGSGGFGGGRFGGSNEKKKDYNFTIKPFYIAKYLTTYAQYQAFVDAPDGYKNREWWKLFSYIDRSAELKTPSNRLPNAPRSDVSWYQSLVFANWLDAQYRQNGLFEAILGLNPAEWQITLPLEWYWQWMAQNGDEKREYPWGNDWDATRANTAEAEGITRRTSSVGMYPHGDAGCGASDVAGNLWEWCLNDYMDHYERKLIMFSQGGNSSRILRGGSFDKSQVDAHAVFRNKSYPKVYNNNYGFRLSILPIVS